MDSQRYLKNFLNVLPLMPSVITPSAFASHYLARQEPIKGANEGQAKYDNRVNEWRLDLGEAKGKAEIIIAKNRYGIERATQLRFDGARQLFHDAGAM